MDLMKVDDGAENKSVSFRVSTLKKIANFRKKEKIKKFSPIVDRIVSDWLDKELKEKEK